MRPRRFGLAALELGAQQAERLDCEADSVFLRSGPWAAATRQRTRGGLRRAQFCMGDWTVPQNITCVFQVFVPSSLGLLAAAASGGEAPAHKAAAAGLLLVHA